MKELKLLGLEAEDKVRRFRGVITSISFDLNGCIMALLSPPTTEDGKLPDTRWFDVKGLKIIRHAPVYEQPDFVTVPGGRDLPSK